MKRFEKKRNPKGLRGLTKHYFQLLELMIAMMLILLCVVPALQVCENIYRDQLKVIRVNERDHLIRSIFANIVERLYNRQIPLQELSAGVNQPVDFTDAGKKLTQLQYQGVYRFEVLRPEKIKNEDKKYLVKLEIILKDLKDPSNKDLNYDYALYIDRGDIIH